MLNLTQWIARRLRKMILPFIDWRTAIALAALAIIPANTSCMTNRIPNVLKPSLPSGTFRLSPDVHLRVESGEHDGQSVLFLHGFGASLDTWKDIRPELDTRFNTYYVDLKGFGLSSKPQDNRYAPSHQAEIICAFIQKHDLRNLALVGHSYGGSVAMMAWLLLEQLHQEERISSLILIDSACYPQAFPFFVSNLRLPVYNVLLLNLTSARFRAALTLRRIFHDPARVTDERIDRYARYFDLPGSHSSFISAARQILDDDPGKFAAQIPKLRVKTLVIWGRNDPVIPLQHAYRLHQEIVNSQLVIIDKCGHVPHEERPEETSRSIIEFLR